MIDILRALAEAAAGGSFVLAAGTIIWNRGHR